MTDTSPLVAELSVQAFRSIRNLTIHPGMIGALVGEAGAGKSNLLAAIRAVLDPEATVGKPDVPRLASPGGAAEVAVSAKLRDGRQCTVRGVPPALESVNAEGVDVVYLPAAERAGDIVDGRSNPERITGVRDLFSLAVADADARMAVRDDSPGGRALSLVDAVEECCREGSGGAVVLIEEPELFLRPQMQRYLYRALREMSERGNQVLYTTHSPAFLNVARLDELIFVERRVSGTTHALQPSPMNPEEDFRILSEFDAERAELFLARAVILVEGLTEKLALPFVFEALGENADHAGVSIVECGGKSNIILFARVCKAAGVPFIAVYDRDARPGQRPSASNRQLASAIKRLAGKHRSFELAPDFEAVSRVEKRGKGKPERAWRSFSRLSRDQMPEVLLRIAELSLELSRGLPESRELSDVPSVAELMGGSDGAAEQASEHLT